MKRTWMGRVRTENTRRRASLKYKEKSLSVVLIENLFECQIKEITRVSMDDYLGYQVKNTSLGDAFSRGCFLFDYISISLYKVRDFDKR